MAVQQVVQGVLGDALPQEKQVRQRRVSSNTGALSRARKRLPLTIVEAVCDEIFTQLTAAELCIGLLARLFPLDGSSIRLQHTPALAAAYPLVYRSAKTYPYILVSCYAEPMARASTRPRLVL